MKLPSVKTLSRVFTDAKQARAIFEMSREQLLQTKAGSARNKECYHSPTTCDLRMHTLRSIEDGLYGLEAIQSVNGFYAEYINTGDMYAPTVIYWRGAYRVQSLGDFVETMERQGIRF